MTLSNNKWIKYLRERLTIGRVAFLAFVVFIIFIDENSCIQQAKYDREIDRLTQQIEAQNDTTEYYNTLVEKLQTSKELVEQIAREDFLMSKSNEHVYLIEETPNANP